ncbi:MAG: cell division ATP-binding protein FtsE [Dethiobacteria bacterium]|jgi:cell division transport system ATP-binding protein
MIELHKVTKVYDSAKEPALKDINLKIASGEFVFVVGPSGAGKTTLIKLIFREQLPSAGRVLFCGRDTAKYKPRELLQHRRQMGIVFQDFRLLSQKTVFENVAFTLEVLGRSPREIRRKVPQALEQVGLLGKENSFPSELSGGEQQRVGVARAIAKDPLVLLADEPTGNLDPENAALLIDLFARINKENKTTVVIATHAWEIVGRMQKRVVSLDQGQLVGDEKQGGYSYVR